MRYVFLGDRLTREDLRGMVCDPVRAATAGADGKCVVSTRMAVALVIDAAGRKYVVPRRRLRLRRKFAQKLEAR